MLFSSMSVLRNQQHFARGLTPLKAFMGFGRIAQGEGVFHAQCELASGNPPQDIPGALLETGAIGRVVPQGRPGEEQRAFPTQDRWIKGRYWPTSLPIEYQIPEWSQAIQT